MKDYSDIILHKTRQHVFMLFWRIGKWLVPFLFIVHISRTYLFPESNNSSIVLWGIVGTILICGYFTFLWYKSYLLITNEKLVKKVRNGIFSKFHMSIHYDNIRDVAFSKNNIFHYILGAGTLFARSSASAVADFEAYWTPDIERVYKIVNTLHTLSPDRRTTLTSLTDIMQHHLSSQESNEGGIEETVGQAAEKEKQILLSIKGIKEVVLLDDKDRRYIFEHEEDRNHGVYESLRKEILFAVTHDSTLREPDNTIVMKAGDKVIFPTVDFHEIKRPAVISSSPGIDIHHYLIPKFEKLGEFDATLIIGFDR